MVHWTLCIISMCNGGIYIPVREKVMMLYFTYYTLRLKRTIKTAYDIEK